MTTGIAKPILSLSQIIQMNVGFLGLQFSFGLQQSNMSPIYSYLGADEAARPLLSLAGPMTGLLVQPIVGAMSDRTASRYGRRTPYFLMGPGDVQRELFRLHQQGRLRYEVAGSVAELRLPYPTAADYAHAELMA